MWALKLEEVTKRFRMGGVQRDSLGRVISGAPRRIVKRLSGQRSDPRPQTGKLALDRISLEVEEGDSYALIGSNGAGKSTALRIISRISPPTSGKVRVRGRVGALIEVSAGVHPELTGRENIWLYGSIIGMPRAEIRQRFDDIVEFSGLSESLDTQVKFYSSGMQLRLGFSIASHIEPDVFVVDEALAVGDVTFQSRCVERMTKLSREGTTLLFVSHHLSTVEALCTRGALLADGHVLAQGDLKPVLSQYVEMIEENQLSGIGQGENVGPLRILGATCHGANGEEQAQFKSGDPIEIRLRFEGDKPLERPYVSVGISDGRPGMLVQCSMLEDGMVPERVGTHWECRLLIAELPLLPRLYRVWAEVFASDAVGTLTEWLEVAAFRVVGEVATGPRAVVHSMAAGALAVPYSWDIHT
jgi:ABC-type polysaccharide/polyol phosphate transport system ATPase subunit